MKLFRRKKPREAAPIETDEPSVVKLTQSASTEASSYAEDERSAGKDVLDELVEKGYDPDNGGRLLLLESISYESGDRYAIGIHIVHPEGDEERDDDPSSWEEDDTRDIDIGNSESRDSTFYTIDTQENTATSKIQEEESTWASPRRPVNRHDSDCSTKNKLRNSWSLKSAGSMPRNNIYHSDIKGTLPSNSSIPSFLNRTKSTPRDVTTPPPADPPGEFFDKYRQIHGVQSKEVSVLPLHGAEAAAKSHHGSNENNSVSSVSASVSGNAGSSTNSSILYSRSVVDSSVDSSGETPSTISDDSSHVSSNPWRCLSRPAASFRSKRKNETIPAKSQQEYDKHREAMAFQSAPSFVTGTFVPSLDEVNNNDSMNESQEEGAIECMIVPPDQVNSNRSFEQQKNLPPTPSKKVKCGEGTRGFHARGEYFRAMREYWDAKAASNGISDIPRPPTFDPDVYSRMSMEDAILKQAMSMGSLDVIPVPKKSWKPALLSTKNAREEKAKEEKKPTEVAIKGKKSQSKTKHPKKEKPTDIHLKTTRKEAAVEVAIEPKQSVFWKLNSLVESSSSGGGSSGSSGKMKKFFQKKKKEKYFEGVVERDNCHVSTMESVAEVEPLEKKENTKPPMRPAKENMEEISPPPLPAPIAKPDPIPQEPPAVLKRMRAPEPPQAPQAPMRPIFENETVSEAVSATTMFDVPRDVLIRPDNLGKHHMEEERMADELVGFVKLMPLALLSFFKEKNPDEDLQLNSRSHNFKRRASSLSTHDVHFLGQESKSGVVSHGIESFISEQLKSTSEDSLKHLNFMELTPSVFGDSPEEETLGDYEEVSDRTEKRRGGILRTIRKKKDVSLSSKACLLTGHLRTPRMSLEEINAMAEKEVKLKTEEGVETIAGVTKQGQKAIVISNTKRYPNQYLEDVYHA